MNNYYFKNLLTSFFLFTFLVLAHKSNGQYCVSRATSASYRPQIVNVSLNTINNTTPNNVYSFYSDFSAISTVLVYNQTYNLSIATRTDPGSSDAWTKTVTAYIDWNQDLDFVDAGERVFLSPNYNGVDGVNTVFNTTITVPAFAITGSTRLRVILQETSGATASCGTYNWGETEDYTINFCGAADGIKVAALGMPNCSGGTETLNLTGLTSGEAIQWQSSTDNVNWTNVAGATGSSFSTGAIGVSTYYRALITKGGCTAPTGSYLKTTVSINITAGPSSNICFGGEAQLNVPFLADYYKAELRAVTSANPINSQINVAGLPYPIIASDIKEVCLNTQFNNSIEDLDIFLVSPQGTQIELSTDNGGTNGSYTYTCFKPTAVTPITAGGSPYRGDFLPEQPFTNFNGENPNGVWTLRVVNDDNSSINFLDWTLGFNVKVDWRPSDPGLSAYNIPNPIASPDVSTTYEATLSNNGSSCTAKASIAITVGARPQISIPTPPPFCFNQTVTLNPTITPTSSTSYNRTFFNLEDFVIPDGGVGGGFLGGWNGSSGTFVDSPIMVSCLNPRQNRYRINRVCFNIIHGRAVELELYLVAPNGALYLLMNGVGGANAVTFTNTCLVPNAARPIINAGTAPFTGDYRPEGNGNNFTGAIDDGNPNGTWRLRAGDDLTFDTGKILDWSIEFGSDNEIVTTTWTPANELSDANIPNPTVIPQTDGTKTFTLFVQEASCCKNEAPVTVPVDPKRIANAGLDQSACASDIIQLAGSVSGTATGGTWSSSTGGTFNNANLLNATYTPSGADIAAGSVTLTLTPTGGNPATAMCPDFPDNVTITFTGPLTTVSASPANVCSGQTVTLSSNTTLLPATKDFNFSNTTDFNIPDGGISTPWNGTTGSFANSTIDVAGLLPCAPTTNWTVDKVCFNITHAYTDDVSAYLEAPNGTRLLLVEREGGSGDNFTNTCFVAGSTNPIAGKNAPFTGNFRPEGGNLLFAGFDPNGTWRLKIGDRLNVDPGILRDWSISFKTTNSIINRNWTSAPVSAIATPTAATTIVTPASGTTTTYQIDVNDAYCCAARQTIAITPLPPITFTKTANTTICQGNAANLAATTIAGGNGTYNISWTSSPAGFAATTAAVSVSPTVTTKYYITISSGSCSTTDSVTVTVNPRAVVTPGTYAAICQSGNVNLNGTILAGATPVGGTWSVSPIGAGTFNNPNLLNAVFTPQNVGTFTLTLTSADPDGAGPCPSSSANTTIVINQPAIVTVDQNSILICQESMGVPVSGNIQFADSANWSVVPAGAVVFASTTANTNTFNAATGFFGNATISYTTNDPAGPCPSVKRDIPVTISQKPTVNAGPNLQTCEDSPIAVSGTIGGSATSAVWTCIPAANGTFANPNSLTTTFTPTTGFVGSVDLRLTSNAAAPCTPAFDDLTLVVSKKPSVTVGADQVICQGTSTPISASVLPSTLGGSWKVEPAGLGTFAAFSSKSTTFTPNINFFGSLKLIFTTDDPAGPCIPVTDTLNITINPRAIVNTGTYPAICETQTVQLNGDIRVAGLPSTGTWTAVDAMNNPVGTFSNPNSLNPVFNPNGYVGTVTLRLTSTGTDVLSPCAQVSATTTINISQRATVVAGADTNICQGVTSPPLGGLIGGSASSSNWTVNPVDAGIFEDPSDPNSKFIPNPNYVGAAILTIRITTNDPSGPCPAAFEDVELTLEPKAVVNPGLPDTICIGDVASLNGIISINGVPLDGNWSIVSGGTGTFSPVNGKVTSFTPDNAGTYLLRLTSIDPAGPCVEESAEITLTVNALPIVEMGSYGEVCNQANPFELRNGKPVGATGVYTINGLGYTANEVITPPLLFEPIRATSLPSTYFITYTYTDPITACVNDTTTTLIVTANPAVPTIPDVNICQGVDPIITPLSPADEFRWYRDALGTDSITTTQGNVNSGAFNAETFDGVDNNIPGTYTYYARAVSGTGPSACVSDPLKEVKITINEIPNDPIVVSGLEKICAGQQATYTVTAPNPASFKFRWYDSANNLLVKSASYTTPVIPNNGTTQITRTFTVESIDENFPSNCVSINRETVTLLINPLPVTPSADSLEICSGEAAEFFPTSPDSSLHSYIWFNTPINGTRLDSTDGSLSRGVQNTLTTVERFFYFNAIADSSGCVSANRGVVRLKVNPLPILTTLKKDVSCFEGSDGNIAITITSGNSPYKLDLDGVPIDPIPAVIDSLSSKDYQLTVVDSVGCITQALVGIVDPPLLVTSASGTDLKCFEDASGMVNFTATGGTLPYSFTVNGLDFQSDSAFTGLDSNLYAVYVKDGNGCITDTFDILVSQPPKLSGVVVKIQDVQCFDTPTGATNVLSVVGGTPTYTYKWNPNNVLLALNDTIRVGDYDVEITDANGCSLNSSTLAVTEPEALTIDFTKDNVSCNGGTNGAIDVFVDGGTEPYSYTWSDNPSLDTPIRTDLPAGTYVVIAKDANNCSVNITIEITEPVVLDGSAIVTNLLCFEDATGEVELNATGGTAPYTFNLNGNVLNAANSATSVSFTGLDSNSYVATITDDQGCIKLVNFNITQPAQLINTIDNSKNVSCFNGSDGEIFTTTQGGTLPYTYTWNSGQNTDDITGLPIGTYQLNVVDANACAVNSEAVIITQPTELQLSEIHNSIDCFDQATGFISVTTTGGTLPYNFSWNDGITTEDRTSIKAGTYTLTVTDALGCSKIISATITQPNELTATVTKVDLSCFNENIGSITFDPVSGGTLPYSFSVDGTAGTTNPVFTNLTAGDYKAQIVDGLGCVFEQDITITQPDDIVISEDLVGSIKCYGNKEVDINISTVGGTGALNFAWNTGETTESLSQVGMGTYQLTVTDANGCFDTSSTFIVNEPQDIQISESHTDVPCNNDPVGAITLSVIGGTIATDYNYQWSNGATTKDLSNLNAGRYTITITDDNNCKDSLDVFVTEPNGLLFVTDLINLNCNNDNSGQIGIEPQGGVAPYTVSLNGGPGFASPNRFIGLPAGAYTIELTDANGCIFADNAVLNEPSNLSSAIAITDIVSCNGLSDGNIAHNISGGIAPYLFTWYKDGADAMISTPDLNNVPAGSYYVITSDRNNCMITSNTVVLNDPLPLSINTQVTSNYNGSNISCFGASDGSAVATPVGGTANYSYQWSNGTFNQILSNVAAGTYTVQVTDANGCIGNGSVTLTQPTQLTTSASVTSNYNGRDIRCFNGSDGTAAVIANGGTPGYNYTWSAGSNSNVQIGLGAGTYSVTVRDANNCPSIATVTLSQPTALVLNLTPTNLTCNNSNDGKVYSTLTGGTAPYTYSWNTGSTLDSIVNRPIGNYTLTARDANLCSVSRLATITQPAVLLANVTSTNVVCNGDSNGTATSTPTGGTPGYTYTWNNGITSSTISPLAPGSYNVTVRDSRGCLANGSVIITQPSPIVSTVVVDSVRCFGESNGAARVGTTTGGISPYSYTWTTPTTTISNVSSISNQAAGPYTLTTRDANACTTSTLFTIAQPPVLVASHTQVNNLCFGNTSGRISMTVNGGNPGTRTNSWSDGPSTALTRNNLAAGTYVFTVRDIKMCTDTQSVTITQPTQLSINRIDVDSTSCELLQEGFVQVTGVGGTPGYTYNWSNGETTSRIDSLAGNTSYTVTVRDANACSMTFTQFISDEPIPVSDFDFIAPACSSLTTIITTYPTDGLGTWARSEALGLTFTKLAQQAAPNDSITWEVSALNFDQFPLYWDVDRNGCVNSSTDSVNFRRSPTAGFNYLPSKLTTIDNEAYFKNQSINYDSLVWNFYNVLTTSELSPRHRFPDQDSGTYEVCLTAISNNGCVDSICDIIFVNGQAAFYIPNAFTPNNDGKNEIFAPVFNEIDVSDYNIVIFNRWGEVVFESSNPNEGWDGFYKGVKLPPGTFSWRVEYKQRFTVERKIYYGSVNMIH